MGGGVTTSSQNRSTTPTTGGTTATMTVTSPAWSGTSWTGGMAYGCTAALKTSGSGGRCKSYFCIFMLCAKIIGYEIGPFQNQILKH